MAYAKDFPYEYERNFNGTTYHGIAIFCDERNGDLPSQRGQCREVMDRLRAVGLAPRSVRGVYGSRRHANALRGWMVFVPVGKRTPEQSALLDKIDEEYD